MKRLLPILLLASISARAQMFIPTRSGAGYPANSLSNIEIGKFTGRTVDYRFVCDHAGTVTQVQVFFVFRGTAGFTGYWNGNGGTILVQLEADDGSGQPSGSALSSYSIADPLTANCGTGCVGASYRTITLSPASVPLTAGSVYHLVFTNTAADPINNFISLDGLGTSVSGSNVWPVVKDSTYAMLFSNAPPLVVSSNVMPLLNVIYDDAYRQGVGYIDDKSLTVAAGGIPSQIEQTFTVGSSDFVLNGISVRFTPVASGSATVTLYDGSLSVVASGTIGFVGGIVPPWYSVGFPSVKLTATSTYTLVVAPTSGSLTAKLLEHGTLGLVTEGWTQHCSQWSGSSWSACYSNAATDMEYYLNQSTLLNGVVVNDVKVF